MDDLKGEDVNAFIAWRRAPNDKGKVVCGATINRELDCLSAMINHAVVQLEWVLPNPVRGRSLKESEGSVRWITREEAERLIQCAESLKSGPRTSDFIALGLHTGARMNELLELEWRRVNWDQMLLTLEPEDNKTTKRRSIPLNAVAMAALKRRAAFTAMHCPDSPWVFCKQDGSRLVNPREGFKRACKLAGITNFRIHDMRHTCASWLVMNGVPLLDVKEVLGHTTIKMTEKYAHLAPHRAHEAVATLVSHQATGGGDEVTTTVASKTGAGSGRRGPEGVGTQFGHNGRPAQALENLLTQKSHP